MSILVISTSLSSDSRSRALAYFAYKYAKSNDYKVEFVDLRDYPLPMCDGDMSFSDENVATLADKILSASSVLLAGAVYTYSIGASTKNLIDMTGAAWKSKPVGLIVTGSGRSSYMSATGLINSLMLNHRCPIIPRYVYGDSGGFEEEKISEDLQHRLQELVDTTKHWGEVL